jgi:diguanylate cyclase (GGDEF)-like protein
VSENVIIAIVAPAQPEDFYDEVWEGVWEATFDLAAFGVRVDNLTTEYRDVARQRELLEGLLGTGVAAIAIVPAHTYALDDLIDRHELSGTRVITLQGDAPGSKRSAFVGADARRSGALAGEVLAKLMGGCGRVLSFPGDQEEFQQAGRYAGLRTELGRHAGLIQETGERSCPDLKNALKSADGVYVGNEDLAMVAAALEQAGVRVPCVGFSNTGLARQLLKDGLVSAVVDESRHQQGYFAVQKAYQATLQRDGLDNLSVPSSVAFSANAAELQESLNDAFELLVRQRTEVLCSYKTRLEQANSELLSLSITDPLTGMLNRRQFEASLEQEVARARRYGAMSLLMVDVDLFKTVNDTYGHQTGDEILKMVASVLKECSRNTDICARLGGDEFGVILPHSDRAAAAIVRERIVRRMADTTVATVRHRITVSVSVGIGTLPGDAEHVAGLVAAADADMYRVKQASRISHRPVAI